MGTKKIALLCAAVSLMLPALFAACGGGGGGSRPDPYPYGSVIERVSVDSAGTQSSGGSSSSPSISSDGRYVAFSSYATNLVTGDTNNLEDIFVHDRQTGATTRVSVDSAGNQSSGGGSSFPSISSDGRYVAFESDAENLIAGDTNLSEDIFAAPVK